MLCKADFNIFLELLLGFLLLECCLLAVLWMEISLEMLSRTKTNMEEGQSVLYILQTRPTWVFGA